MKIRIVKIKGEEWHQVDCGNRNGKRFRRTFQTEAEAKRFYRQEQERLKSHGTLASTIPVRQLVEMVDCWERARKLGVSIGALLDRVESGTGFDYTSPEGAVTLRQAADALYAAKSRDTTAGYLKNLRLAVDRFVSGREAQPVSSVSHGDIQEWLDNLGHSNGGAAYRLRVNTLFAFAMRQGWVHKNPCHRLERVRKVYGAPTILTPMQWGRVLAFVCRQRPDYLPWFILAGFEGLRPFEADQIQRDDIDLEHGLLTVRGETSKTGRKRVIELGQHTLEWLRWSLANGGNLGFRSETRVKYTNRVARLALRLPQWPKDVLRHTAASVMCAVWKDAPRAALHLGNSVPVIMRHYLNAIPPRVAQRYWSYRPSKKVAVMDRGAAAA